MPESLKSRAFRWGFNLFPAYRGTGARITYISADDREIRVRIPLSWRTRNYVGTIFGGSLYGAVDPLYMIILIRTLGPEYVVWDKSAAVRFRKPGKTELYARCLVTDEELAEIRAATASGQSVDRIYHIELADAQGVVHAEVEKKVYIRRKDAVRARDADARTEAGG